MSIVSIRRANFDIPSLDEQAGNMPGIALNARDEDFERWLDDHEHPITPEEDEAAFREWLQEQALTANRPAPRPRYFMLRIEGKGATAWFEIRRDTDGEWMATIHGRAEAQREVDKLNSVA